MTPRRRWRGPGVQGVGVRLTGVSRVPESTRIGDRSEAATHRRPRPSDTDGIGPVWRPNSASTGLRPAPKKAERTPANALAADDLPTRHRRRRRTLPRSPGRTGSRLRPIRGHSGSGADARLHAADISAQRRVAIASRASRRPFVQCVGTESPEPDSSTHRVRGTRGSVRRWIDEASDRVLTLGGPLTHAAVLVDRTDSFLVYACSITPWGTDGASISR